MAQNNIIFTQDFPGERAWLATQFPEFNNVETEFSGLWPNNFFKENQNTIWEVPPDSLLDVSQFTVDTYKSLYQLDTEFVSSRWCDANKLLINQLEFGGQPRAEKAQVLHFGRCGTVFLESILFNKCGYTKDYGWDSSSPGPDHAFMGSPSDNDLYNIVEKSQPDIFLCYRSDWWGWITSVLIGKKFDFYHYNDNVDWNNLPSFQVAIADIELLADSARANWQSLCHFRTQFPHLNFYIFEFSDLVKNNQLTEHRAITYNKKNLIQNYEKMHTLFDSTYLPKFLKWQENCLKHLQTMKCSILTNFDNFVL
jgi:hypothetical protein